MGGGKQGQGTQKLRLRCICVTVCRCGCMGFPGELVGSSNEIPVWGWIMMEGVCEKDVHERCFQQFCGLLLLLTTSPATHKRGSNRTA